MSKEDKFFERLRDFAGFTGRVGFLLEETAEGRMAVSESYKECFDIKMKCRESYGLLMERMYKAYKDPSQLDNARGRTAKSGRVIHPSLSYPKAGSYSRYFQKHSGPAGYGHGGRNTGGTHPYGPPVGSIPFRAEENHGLHH